MSQVEEDIEASVLEEVIERVHRLTGVTMSDRKKTLLIGRLGKRLRSLGLATYREYLERIESDSGERQEFINSVTTHETVFFRTPPVWEHFAKVFLPRWTSLRSGRPLRIWSAAASTGEEAYSIAITCESWRAKNPGFEYRIDATDIATDVIERAKSGIYAGRSGEDLRNRHADAVRRFFTIEGSELQVRPELRARVHFSVHNLFTPPKERGAYDIVFLRNVLIYFSAEDQKRVLREVGSALAPDGILILGESESLAKFETEFRFESPLIYRKAA